MDKYLIRTIIIMMTSIGQVEYRMHEQFTGIYRDGILFAKVQAEGLYLLNGQNTFIKIDKEEEIKDQLRQAYSLALVSAWTKNMKLDLFATKGTYFLLFSILEPKKIMLNCKFHISWITFKIG